MIEVNIANTEKLVGTAIQNFAVKKLLDFKYSKTVNALGQTFYQVLMTLKTSTGLEFTLPVDPLVSVSTKYDIVTRNVKKQGTMRGTIKELWNQSDYSITIAGILMASDSYTLQDYQRKLLAICNTPEAVMVECEMLNDVFEVLKIAIESLDFPFTKGENNQSFTIKALSDESYSLLS